MQRRRWVFAHGHAAAGPGRAVWSFLAKSTAFPGGERVWAIDCQSEIQARFGRFIEPVMQVRGLSVLLPISRALIQMDDPRLRGVFLRSFAWSLGCFAGLYASSVWIVHRVLELHGWLAWAADAFGSILASLLALWLFLPVAAAIGLMHLERIVDCVERRFYPWLPPPSAGASLLVQVWDSTALALKVLALNVLALIIAFVLPGLGLFLGWIISAYGIGRGLFFAVAMRRMSRKRATFIYRRSRVVVLAQGMLLAAANYVPVLNLLIPVAGVMVMVHTLELALGAADRRVAE